MSLVFQAIISFGAAFLGAFLAYMFARWQFKHERVWEAKYNAYSKLIGSLYDLAAYPEEEITADMEGREISGNSKKALVESYRMAKDHVNRAIWISRLTLPDDARERLRAYRREQSKDQNSWVDAVLSDMNAAYSCLDDIVSIARKDLRISSMKRSKFTETKHAL